MADDSLIERAAEALHEVDPWLYGQDLDGFDIYKPWSEAPDAVRDEYRKGARAVLAVLRGSS